MPRPRIWRRKLRDHAAVLVRQQDGDVWRPDAAVRINFSPSYSVTDHPVEDGGTISDHIQAMPETIVCTMLVSENPDRIGSATGGRIHLRDRMKWLRDTADAGQLVDIVTRRLGVFKGYAITSFPHGIDKVARLEFQITLRKITIATATSVMITVEQVQATDEATGESVDPETEFGAPDEIDTGEQPTTDTSTDSEEAEEDDQSTLASLLDAV